MSETRSKITWIQIYGILRSLYDRPDSVQYNEENQTMFVLFVDHFMFQANGEQPFGTWDNGSIEKLEWPS
jgi:hypothetical protein